MDKTEILTKAMWDLDESMIREGLDADEEMDQAFSSQKARKSPAKKRLPWAAGIAAAILLSGITAYVVSSMTTKALDHAALCKEASGRHEKLFSGKQLKYLDDASDDPAVPGTKVFSDGDYKYYENSAGQIVWIERIDPRNGIEQAESAEDCTKEALDWFDRVYQNLRLAGSTLEVRKEPFDGGMNLMTVIEMLNGAQTGNQASLTFGKDRTLFAAAFLYTEKKAEDHAAKEALSQAEAFEYAKAAVLADAREKYDYQGDLPEDLYNTCKGTLRTFNGQEFWEFENVCIWVYNPEWAERDDGTYPQYYMVRIDAYTGECLLLGRSQ